jgi:hypothetical protein
MVSMRGRAKMLPSTDRCPAGRARTSSNGHWHLTTVHVGAPVPTAHHLRVLLGLAPRLLTEGSVVPGESALLEAWRAAHPEALMRWPVSLIAARLQLYYFEGRIDVAEREQLQALRTDLGAGTVVLQLGPDAESAAIPLDLPPPVLEWAGETFVFIGRCAFGTRTQCEGEVLGRGGRVTDHIVPLTTIVVLGSFSEWGQATDGCTLEDAIARRPLGLNIRLVSEEDWVAALECSLSTNAVQTVTCR